MVPETISGYPRGQNSFHHTTEMLFASFTMLTFALMMQKQW